MPAVRLRAASFVKSFSYHDRLAGRPIHDEQGTYDRPHDLTCFYQPAVIDKLLARLGSRPWLGPRPELTIFLDVQRSGPVYDVVGDSERHLAMRQAFMQAADPLGFRVRFPSSPELDGLLQRTQHEHAGDLDAGEVPVGTSITGHLSWSDSDLGWVADWTFLAPSGAVRWQVRGVSFDEAFRAAIKGVAQILSGNGNPPAVTRAD